MYLRESVLLEEIEKVRQYAGEQSFSFTVECQTIAATPFSSIFKIGPITDAVPSSIRYL